MSQLTFAKFFTALLVKSRLSLGDVERDLYRRGYKINKSTLSRWSSGETKPRRDKLELLRQFPKTFSMTPPEIQTMNRVLYQLTGSAGLLPVPDDGDVQRRHFLGGRMVDFYGREREIAELKTAVSRRQTILITGMGGIGKTSLARKLLEESYWSFSYGCEVLQLSPYQRPSDILLQIAQRLNIPVQVEQMSQDIKLALMQLRRKGADKDILFLLDNVDQAEQVMPFVYGLPSITWVFTSRRKLYLPAPDLVMMELALPTADEAAQMLLHYVKLPESVGNTAVSRRIAAQLGYLPIALRTAVGLFRTSQFNDLSQLEEWLSTRGTQGLQVESWHINDYFDELLMMAHPPNARVLFALCGLFTMPTIFTEALSGIAANLGLPITLLGRLEAMSLLQHHDDRTISIHPLLHEYAVKYVQNLPQYSSLLTRFTVWYAHYAAERRGQYDELQPDFQNILCAADYAYENEDWESFYLLWGPITGQLWVQSRWTAYLQMNERYLEAAIACEDKIAEAKALSRIGWTQFEQGLYEAAESNFRRVIKINDMQGLVGDGVRVRRHLGILYTEWGKLELAQQYLHEAKAMAGTIEQAEQANFCIALISHAEAGIAMELEDYATAQSCSEQAMELLSCADEQAHMPMLQLRFGDVLHLRGDFIEAESVWRQIAINGRENYPEERIIAGAMQRLAQVESVGGNKIRALDWAYEARDIYIKSNLTELRHRIEALINKLGFADETIAADQESAFELWD